jgi:hypothetical protein
MEGIVWFEM